MKNKAIVENKETLIKYMRKMAKNCGKYRHIFLELEFNDINFKNYGNGLYSAAPKGNSSQVNIMFFAVPSRLKKSNNYKSLW